MKIKQFFMAALCSTVIFSSCKKDKTPDPVINNDPEQLEPQANKVFHYSFNGNLNDGSGSNLNAADSNNITYTADRFGRANQAVLFGSSSTINIITPSLSSKITGFPCAVSFWFKTEDVSDYQTIIKSDGLERNTYSGFTVQMNSYPGSGILSFSFGNNTGTSSSSYKVITSPEVITSNNTWYHVVINLRTAEDYDFYINGTKYTNCITQGTAASMAFNSPSNGILGLYDGMPNSNFNGALDDYRIYTKSLTQQEVSELYNFHP
jgi:hypothetical protein